jgi:hypothetical protein
MPGTAKGSAANEIFYSTISRRAAMVRPPYAKIAEAKWYNARHSGAAQRNPESRASALKENEMRIGSDQAVK